ncbi:MAG: TrkH family potassium uptake protein [Planctomycetota bacterium]
MNLPTVFHILGKLLLVYAGTMLVPIAVSIAHEGLADHRQMHEPFAFLIAALITAAIGGAMRWWFRQDLNRFGHREGYAIVTLGWTLFAIFGALPWLLLGVDVSGKPLALNMLDAVFETMSGLTTTGATILPDIERYGHGILFWRAMTHWLGGMGIVVLVVAILPGLGAGGYQLLRAEVPGPTADKIAPRIAQTAKILWGVYIVLTVAQVLLLWGPSWFASEAELATGAYMNLYESVCHTFATLATGGFSTRNASMGAWGPWYQYVVIAFMLAAGTNFLLHWHLLCGRPKYLWRSAEFRFYIGLVGFCTLVIFLAMSFMPIVTAEGHGDDRAEDSQDVRDEVRGRTGDNRWKPSPEKYATTESTFRHSLFQVASIVTTTGFGTADFDRWPDVCRLILVCLMFIGGCAGSTGGGLKMIRVLVVVRHAFREVRQLIFPSAVVHVKVQGERVGDRVVGAIIGTFTLYLLLLMFGMIAFSFMPGFNLVTAFTCSASCIGNIGPGLGMIGPVENYSWIPEVGKGLCCALMLLGRLEIYTVLVLFFPAIYKK